MVDPERLRRLLQAVTDRVNELGPYAEDPEGLLDDKVRLGYVKYTLQTALEACIDAAQHVCASEGWGAPSDNADAMLILARHGALDEELATRMAAAVRFRNVLVHLYEKVDDRRAVENLEHLDVLERFVEELSTLIE